MSFDSSGRTTNFQRPALVAKVRLYDRKEARGARIIRQGDLNEFCVDLDGASYRETGWLQLGSEEFKPGETRTVGIYFLAENKAVAMLKRNGKFYIGAAAPVGEAEIVCW
ncbi:MAG: hypothetical protein ACX94B_11545 [Henriciella sp.]